MSTRSDWPRTRTWLPESDRLGPSRSRRRGYLSALLVFGLLLLGGLYLSVLRPNANGSGADTGNRTGAGTGAGAGAPAEPGQSAASMGSTVVAGVPVGSPRTRAGAEAAAANYLAAYGSEAMYDPDARAAIVAAIAAPADQDDLMSQLDESFGLAGQAYGLDATGAPAEGLEFVARTVPVGVRIASFRANRAVVDVWAVSVVGLAGENATKPITEAWNTATVTLRWTADDWKWDSLIQRVGPTPVSGLQPPSSTSQLADVMREFEELRHGR